jgi:hypothetical protein
MEKATFALAAESSPQKIESRLGFSPHFCHLRAPPPGGTAGGGHGASAGTGGLSFSRLDRNNDDGMISREGWDAWHPFGARPFQGGATTALPHV